MPLANLGEELQNTITLDWIYLRHISSSIKLRLQVTKYFSSDLQTTAQVKLNKAKCHDSTLNEF